MAFDMFLTFDGATPPIPGDSVDKDFPNAIVLRSISFGIENIVTIGSAAGGAGAGKAKFEQVEITKHPDSSSAALFKLVAMGGHLKTATINFRKNNPVAKAPTVFEKITLSTVFLTKLVQTASSGDDMPVESLTIVCGAIKWESWKLLQNGQTTPVVPAQWSQITNSETILS